MEKLFELMEEKTDVKDPGNNNFIIYLKKN